MQTLPQGTLTFLFTDIEGSTKLVQQLGGRFSEVLEQHQRLLRAAFSEGVEISTEGDSFFIAFPSATRAVEAALAGQRALAACEWPAGTAVRVRMGLHTGQPALGGDSYVGFDVHRAARIAAAGHGGQVLLSESTHALVSRELPDGTTIRDMGEHRLKDLAVPERLFQLVIPGLRAEFPALRSLDPDRTNLPPQLTSFVGRDEELDQLRELCGEHRLVTVIGTGGTGKTRLVIQAAADLVEGHRDGAWLVELAPISNPELVAQTVARALGVVDEPGRDQLETLVDFLRSKALLLLLDNCEHVIGQAASVVHRLLGSCPTLFILATSREALGVAGETVFQVPSLNLPGPMRTRDEHGDHAEEWLDHVRRSDAVRLFVDRASAAMPAFALTAAEAPAVVEICRRLDGIPLAIELAAARVTLLSVDEIASRLGDRFRLLTGGRRTALPRQQTLQALIDWSWQLLSEPEQQLLQRLSVFAGGWTLEAAAAIARLADEPEDELDTLERLGHLVDRSLVDVDRTGTTRYRLLETIRQYARDRLLEAGEASALRDAHLDFFLRLAEENESELRGPRMAAALGRLDADADNLRAALEWAFDANPETALRLSLALQLYWRSRGMDEGRERLLRAAELVHSLPSPAAGVSDERTILVARVLAAAANASWLVGLGSAGLRWAEEAVEVARGTDDIQARYEALGALAVTTVFSGQLEGVVEWTEELFRLAESVGDWWMIGFGQAGLAQWEIERGNVAGGEARLHPAMEAAERAGSPSVIGFAALSYGRVSGWAGRLSEARGWFEKAVAAYREVGDDGMALITRSDLAHALRRGGEIDEAEATYRETLHGWQHAGNRGAMANQLESFAFIAVVRREPERAARLFGAAEAIREDADAAMLGFERLEYDAEVAKLHEMTDAASIESAWAEGRRLTPDEAASFAISG